MPAQLLMRPLKHYVEPGNKHMERNVAEIISSKLGQTASILNPNLTVKGGGAGLENKYAKKVQKLNPKSTWISPFAHRTACLQNKKKNLSLNQCSNLEKSIFVNNNLSLNSQLKPEKLYDTIIN